MSLRKPGYIELQTNYQSLLFTSSNSSPKTRHTSLSKRPRSAGRQSGIGDREALSEVLKPSSHLAERWHPSASVRHHKPRRTARASLLQQRGRRTAGCQCSMKLILHPSRHRQRRNDSCKRNGLCHSRHCATQRVGRTPQRKQYPCCCKFTKSYYVEDATITQYNPPPSVNSLHVKNSINA